ncbi:MAG: hypothetical protein AAGJ28_10750, partial [Pseudomonadota bacterium]
MSSTRQLPQTICTFGFGYRIAGFLHRQVFTGGGGGVVTSVGGCGADWVVVPVGPCDLFSAISRS